MTLLLDSYTIEYVQTGTNNDTGGLLKFEVLPPPKVASQQFIWSLAVVIISTYFL